MADRFRALLEAAREGSEPAWSTIYGGYAPMVLGYLRANRAPEPDDTLSEVFLQVARDLERFEGDERAFRAWVFTIAHHRMVDARRHSARHPAETGRLGCRRAREARRRAREARRRARRHPRPAREEPRRVREAPYPGPGAAARARSRTAARRTATRPGSRRRSSRGRQSSNSA